MLKKLAFKTCLHCPSKKAIEGVIRVYVINQSWKCIADHFFKYLVVENLAKSSGVELRARFGAESRAEDSFNLFILLSTRKKAINITFERLKRTTEARFLRKLL